MPKIKQCRKLKLPRERAILCAAARALIDVLQYGLWIAAPAGQLAIVIAMVCRRIHREFPAFFAYTLFHIAQAILGIVVRAHSYSDYFYFYWASEGVDALLSLAVIQEIFVSVFRQYGALERLGQILFRWAVMVLIALSIVSATAAPGTDTNKLVTGLMVLERSVGFINCSLIFFLFFFCRYFGLHWRHFVFGVAFGMGIMASILTVTAALQAQFQPNELVSRLIPPLAFNIAVGIWMAYSLLPERLVEVRGPLPGLEEVKKWNDALVRVLIR